LHRGVACSAVLEVLAVFAVDHDGLRNKKPRLCEAVNMRRSFPAVAASSFRSRETHGFIATVSIVSYGCASADPGFEREVFTSNSGTSPCYRLATFYSTRIQLTHCIHK
jgi:hypothetical protein